MNIRDFRIAAGAQQTNITQGLLVWLSTGADNNWSTTANWNGNRRPLDGNTLNFGVGSRLYPVNDITALSLNGIAFTPTASSFAISGNAFTQADGSVITNNSNNIQSIANAIVLATGANGITVNTASANITLSGALSGGGTLIKTGANTLTLSGTNTYTGNTTVNTGTLAAGSTTAFGNQTKLTVATGAKFDLNGNDVTISGFTSTTANGTVTNTGSAAKLMLATGLPGNSTTSIIDQLFTGNLSLQLYGIADGNNNSFLTNANNTYNGGTTLGNAVTGTMTRVLLGGGTIGTGGAGTITSGIFGTGAIMIGANTTDKAQLYFANGCTFNYDIIVNSDAGDAVNFVGAVRIEASNVVLAGKINANSADVIFSANNQSNRSGSITGAISGNYGLRVLTQSVNARPGALVLTLANVGTGLNSNTYSGNTTIYGTGNATLKLGANNQIPNGAGKGNLIITAGTFSMAGFSNTINGLSGNGTVDGGNSTSTSTLTVGNNDATGANNTFSGVLKNSTTGTLALTKIGTGTLTLSGNNTYTGGTTISAGTIKIGNIDPFGSGSLILSSGGTLDLNGYAYSFNNTMTSSTTSRIINTGGNISPYIVLKSTTYNCQFDDSMGGSISLLLGQSGVTPVLTNLNNKIRGSVWIPNSNIIVANLNAGSFGSGDLIMGNALNVPSLTYNGSADSNIGSRNIQLFSGSPAGGGASIINNGAGVLTLSGVYAMPNTLTKQFILDGTNTGNNTVTGVIANSSIGTDIVSLEKRGVGKWILTGANTYTGSTSITAGTLVVTAVTSGITAVAVFSSTVLEVTFSSIPAVGATYQFFQGSTVQSYASVTLYGATGRTGSYNKSTSTLTIA